MIRAQNAPSRWRDRRARALRLLRRISLSWGLCLASEWIVDPTLALACAEALRCNRTLPVTDPPPRQPMPGDPPTSHAIS